MRTAAGETLPALDIHIGEDEWSVSGDASERGVSVGALFQELGELAEALVGSSVALGAPPDASHDLLVTEFSLQHADGAFDVRCGGLIDLGDLAERPLSFTATATQDDGWALTGELETSGFDLGAAFTATLADGGVHVDADLSGAELDRATIELGSEVHVSLEGSAGAVTARLDLWRSAGSWQPLIQVGAAELPDDLPVPAEITSAFRDTSIRWSRRARPAAPILGTSATAGGAPVVGPVAEGLSLSTVLLFDETPIGRLLGLARTRAPSRSRMGNSSCRSARSCSPPAARSRSNHSPSRACSPPTSRRHRSSFASTVELELHIDDEESDTLRFAGMVRADMTEGDVMLAVGFLGVVEVDTGNVVPWRDPFGFRGLTVGFLEVWFGGGMRALRGALAVGNASLEIEVLMSGATWAVHFDAEQLTIGELVDGFIGPDASGRMPHQSLPEPIAVSLRGPRDRLRHRGPHLRVAAGGPKRYKQGLKGSADLNLLGLELSIGLEMNRAEKRFAIAGSMEKLDLGGLLVLESTDVTPDVNDRFAAYTGRGGPWAEFELGGEQLTAQLHGKLTLFGLFEETIDGSFDENGLLVSITRSIPPKPDDGTVVTPPPPLAWESHLQFRIQPTGRIPNFEIGGGIDAALRINLRELLGEAFGDAESLLPAGNLIDIGISLSADAYYRDGRRRRSLTGAFVLWGERLSFSLRVSVDLHLDKIADIVLDAVKDAARDPAILEEGTRSNRRGGGSCHPGDRGSRRRDRRGVRGDRQGVRGPRQGDRRTRASDRGTRRAGGGRILAFFGDDRAKRALEQAKRAKEAEVRAKRCARGRRTRPIGEAAAGSRAARRRSCGEHVGCGRHRRCDGGDGGAGADQTRSIRAG